MTHSFRPFIVLLIFKDKICLWKNDLWSCNENFGKKLVVFGLHLLFFSH